MVAHRKALQVKVQQVAAAVTLCGTPVPPLAHGHLSAPEFDVKALLPACFICIPKFSWLQVPLSLCLEFMLNGCTY
jgi:hypothetical protein